MNIKQKKEIADELITLDENQIHIFKQADNLFKLLIIQRGEALFFSMNEKAIILEEFSALSAKVSFNGINNWIDGSKITNKEMLIIKLKELYKSAYKDDLEVVQ